MITNPTKILFEDEKDVIDYVTKGLPPTKKNFAKVINGLNNNGDGIHIGENVFSNENDRELINHALNIVYENRVKNRNITILAMVGLFTAGLFIGTSTTSRKYEKEIKKRECYDLDPFGDCPW